MVYKTDEDGGVEIEHGRVRTGTRRMRSLVNKHAYIDQQDSIAKREEQKMADKLAQGTLQIRVHNGVRANSMKTLETIPSTGEAVVEYLQRLYGRPFELKELSMKLYARGAPGVDWDCIYLIRSPSGVVAFTDMPVEDIPKEK